MEKTKIFGIGLNKTGTTSLGNFFELLGYTHYCKSSYKNIEKIKNKINEIYDLVEKYDMFEDWPWPLIYEKIYFKYPKSKFILTIRKTADDWFDSLLRHSKRSGPTKQRFHVYGHYNPNQKNKKDHIDIYNKHFTDVINFFNRNDPSRLLIININDNNKEKKLYNFIGLPFNKNNYIKFPHRNKDHNKILCDHKKHGCKDTSFIWVNDSKKVIYLEVPKNASKFLKENLKGYKMMNKKRYIKNIDTIYNNYFVFAIFRDFEDRITSTYKYFCLSSNKFRIKQMSSLFKITKKEIEKLSFSEFLNYALKYKDHHWDSQIKYMYINSVKRIKKKPVIYNIKNINELLKKLDISIDLKPINTSINTKINITDSDRELIKKIYEEDYKNINLISDNLLLFK